MISGFFFLGTFVGYQSFKVARGFTVLEKLKLSWKIVIWKFYLWNVFEIRLRYNIIMFSSSNTAMLIKSKNFNERYSNMHILIGKFDFVLKARSIKWKVPTDLWNFGVLSNFFYHEFSKPVDAFCKILLDLDRIKNLSDSTRWC